MSSSQASDLATTVRAAIAEYEEVVQYDAENEVEERVRFAEWLDEIHKALDQLEELAWKYEELE